MGTWAKCQDGSTSKRSTRYRGINGCVRVNNKEMEWWTVLWEWGECNCTPLNYTSAHDSSYIFVSLSLFMQKFSLMLFFFSFVCFFVFRLTLLYRHVSFNYCSTLGLHSINNGMFVHYTINFYIPSSCHFNCLEDLKITYKLFRVLEGSEWKSNI